MHLASIHSGVIPNSLTCSAIGSVPHKRSRTHHTPDDAPHTRGRLSHRVKWRRAEVATGAIGSKQPNVWRVKRDKRRLIVQVQVWRITGWAIARKIRGLHIDADLGDRAGKLGTIEREGKGTAGQRPSRIGCTIAVRSSVQVDYYRARVNP